jgi:hypothetical protein
MVKTTGPRPRYLAECFQAMEQEVYLNSGIAIPSLQGGAAGFKVQAIPQNSSLSNSICCFLGSPPDPNDSLRAFSSEIHLRNHLSIQGQQVSQ